MLTEDLRKASAEIEKLVTSLKKDEWLADHLLDDMEWANNKVKQVVQSALNDTIHRLSAYEEEATLWANNSMQNLAGNPISIRKEEQNKAKVQLKHIQKTIAVLKELLDE